MVKITKFVSITLGVLFRGLFQNFHYKLVYANNVPFEFISAYFPLMNVNDLVLTALLMGDLKKNDIPDKATYVLGYGHLKTFLDAYFAHMALTDIDLSTHFRRR